MIQTILSYALSGFGAVQEVASWAAIHPLAASFYAGLISEIVTKYSPWHGADGLVEVVGKAIGRSVRK